MPDPLVQDNAPDTEQSWIVAEEVGIALVLTLDRLTPEMRAAFLLRDAFDYSFDEIATVVGCTGCIVCSPCQTQESGEDHASHRH